MATYQDIDITLKQTSGLDISLVTEEKAISQSIKNIILTRVGELPYNLNFGSNIHRFLFEKINSFNLIRIKMEIKFALENWEPRIEINSINVVPDEENLTLDISIYYKIITLNESVQQTINIGLRQ